MPREFFLPDCLSKVYQFLFPTLNWSRIHFFDGIPFPLNRGQGGITIASVGFSSDINIYIQEGLYYPCSSVPGDGPQAQESFLALAHELVHALQIQQMLGSGYIPGSWITKYVTCFLTSLSADCDNEIEQEAYEYANGCPDSCGGDLRRCLAAAGLGPTNLSDLCNNQTGKVGPCDCLGVPPFRDTQIGVTPDVQTFLEAIQNSCPLIPKREASSTIDVWSCIGKLCRQIPVIGCILGFAALVVSFLFSLIAIFALPGLTNTSGRIGASAGAIAGGIYGGIVGCAFGPVGCVIGAVVGAIVGAIVGAFIGNVIGGIVDFFGGLGGGGAHSLNLLFSTDDGLSFANKATLERSSEPPALAFGPFPPATALFLAWTGTDDHLNILRAPPLTKSRFGEANDDCGPAIATASSQLFMTWQDGDNNLFISSSPGGMPAPLIGQSFDAALPLPGSSQDSASPALAFDTAGGRLYFAWADDDGHISISGSSDGVNWDAPSAVGERTVGDGTPALAFGHGTLFLAWTGTDDDNHLNVLALTPLPGGFGRAQPKNTLGERSSDDAGPALAFGNDRLFLAWTDDDDRVKVAVSTDDGMNFGPPWDGGEHSSDNAGPALAYLDSGMPASPGLLCLAWVGRD
jgi:hypothetical protein